MYGFNADNSSKHYNQPISPEKGYSPFKQKANPFLCIHQECLEKFYVRSCVHVGMCDCLRACVLAKKEDLHFQDGQVKVMQTT